MNKTLNNPFIYLTVNKSHPFISQSTKVTPSSHSQQKSPLYPTGNLGVFVGPSNQYQRVPPSLPNVLRDTVIISGQSGDNLFSLTQDTCSGTSHDFPVISDVVVHSPGAQTTLCGDPVASAQAKGRVRNVTTASLPATAETIVDAAKRKLMP